MATNTTSINVVKWAYVDQTNPDTHYTINHNTAYLVKKKTNENRILYYGLDTIPQNLKRYRITQVDITVKSTDTDGPWINALLSDFNANTVTWNSGRPDIATWQQVTYTTDAGGNSVIRAQASWVDPSVEMTAMQQILQNRGFAVWGKPDGYHMKTKKADGSVNMIKVTYDSEAVLHGAPRMIQSPSGTVDPRQDIVFAWEMVKHASNWYCMDEVFHQASAKLYWKFSDDENWNTINVGEDVLTATIPAGTLPTGKTVNWYLETVDEDGVTAQTSQSNFATPHNSIYFSVKPLGSEIDIRRPIRFEWSLSSVIGEYDQESATLFWKREEAEEWNSVQVGSEKVIVMPELTFPTFATIVWYLEATDTGGSTAVYQETRFSTASVRIKPVSFPGEDKVNPQHTQYFSWVYSNNTYTDYSQSSASLFWKAKTEEYYHEIAISGNIKSYTVPENTFPTNAEIRWYLQGTDVGGTTTTAASKTFKTVSTNITPQNCPTSGYCDPRNIITFSWYYASDYGDYAQQSAVLYWREAGDETWTEIPVSGNVKTLDIPANTFPVASEIEWYLAGTDASGTTTRTQEYSFSTTATTAFAVCISPVGQVEDGNKPIRFTWIVKNDDGSLPLRTLIEWKYDTESQLQWKTLLDTVSTDTEYVVPEGTFHAGAVEWRVSAYNRDLIQGPENQASFVCLMSPEAPAGLAATPVPRSTIRWQASGQEAYEIVIDGKTIVREYGPGVYEYQLNEPLEDGIHDIAVRVQGLYSLWSEFSTTSIKVENDPGNTVSLSGVFGIDAELSWSLGSEDSDAIMNVYRDGVRIAMTGNMTTFTDRYAIGEHSYFVELWESDGNFSRSNTVTGTISTEISIIADAETGEWMPIRLTENSMHMDSYQWFREHAFVHVCGTDYPIIELGRKITLTGNYSCSFVNREDAKKFEALQGKTVIIKTKEPNLMTGVIVNLDRSVSQFYSTYSFTLQQINREDFIQDET